MNYKWNYEAPTPEQKEAAARLAAEANVSPAIAQMLLQRGLKTADDVRAFFRPQLQSLHDPFLMRDMDVAVERLNAAMGRK
ncbi:MAG: single-stranded-DNA-specific exonuclease RecJ, partial [Bacteroidaceae bacterium]|nr:single-stranded-DNA-specific exonuclease RecJ [Bacteroidaceae bacterium]